MFSTAKYLTAIGMAVLLLCQTVLAGSGGMQLCLKTTGESVQIDFHCSDTATTLCCSTLPRTSIRQAGFDDTCQLCRDIKIEAEQAKAWLNGERSSLKLPTPPAIASTHVFPVEALAATTALKVHPPQGPTESSSALQHYRDVVSLRL